MMLYMDVGRRDVIYWLERRDVIYWLERRDVIYGPGPT